LVKPEAQIKVLECAENAALTAFDSYEYLHPLFQNKKLKKEQKAVMKKYWLHPDPHHSAIGDLLNARQLSDFVKKFL